MTQHKETIINFADTYFWDVFSIICIGVVIFVEIDCVTKIEKTHLLSWNLLNWFTYLFIFYALGLIGDALLGFFPFKDLMEKLKFTNEYTQREKDLESEVNKKFKKIHENEALLSANLSAKVRAYLEVMFLIGIYHSSPNKDFMKIYPNYR